MNASLASLPPTSTPWVSFINCDGSTGIASASDTSDALVTANNAGARVSILYSTTNTTCAVTNEYAKANNGSLDVFTVVGMDVVTTLSLAYNSVDSSARYYNATLLTSVDSAIQAQITSLQNVGSNLQLVPGAGSVTAVPPSGADGSRSPYLLATVSNGQATINAGITVKSSQSTSGFTTINPVLLSLSLAAVLASLLLLVLIGLAWRRTVRNPRRYGPRAPNAALGDAGQTRIAGLSQAILDTIPIVKHFSSKEKAGETSANDEPARSVNSLDKNEVEMLDLPHSGSVPADQADQKDSESGKDASEMAVTPQQCKPGPSIAPDIDDDIACPICLLEFEDGDDVRVLPCDARHRFHDAVSVMLQLSKL